VLLSEHEAENDKYGEIMGFTDTTFNEISIQAEDIETISKLRIYPSYSQEHSKAIVSIGNMWTVVDAHTLQPLERIPSVVLKEPGIIEKLISIIRTPLSPSLSYNKEVLLANLQRHALRLITTPDVFDPAIYEA